MAATRRLLYLWPWNHTHLTVVALSNLPSLDLQEAGWRIPELPSHPPDSVDMWSTPTTPAIKTPISIPNVKIFLVFAPHPCTTMQIAESQVYTSLGWAVFRLIMERKFVSRKLPFPVTLSSPCWNYHQAILKETTWTSLKNKWTWGPTTHLNFFPQTLQQKHEWCRQTLSVTTRSTE